MTQRNAPAIEHRTRRLYIRLGESFGDVVRQYEQLIPVADLAAFARAQNWDETTQLAAHVAPHGFMRYHRVDITGAMAGSSTTRPALQYLMGNHVIAEQMYRHDPAVMLHAPLRVLIFEDPQYGTTLAVDQPSLLFASYGIPAITAVGLKLDGLLADLIRLLDADPGPYLTSAHQEPA